MRHASRPRRRLGRRSVSLTHYVGAKEGAEALFVDRAGGALESGLRRRPLTRREAIAVYLEKRTPVTKSKLGHLRRPKLSHPATAQGDRVEAKLPNFDFVT